MVTIKPEGENAARVAFPYDPLLVAAVKAVPGRRYDPNTKTWIVPVGSPELAAFVVASKAEVGGALLARITGSAQARTESLALSRATDAEIDIPVPAGLSLLPFQKAGVKYALARKDTLIADEMGLGKTVQAITFANADPSIRRAVVICPASLKINWAREIAKWETSPFKVVIGNGQNADSWDDLFHDDEVGWLVINYDILKKWRPFLMTARLDLLVLDEAHYVKTPKAQRTVAIIGKWDAIPSRRVEPIPARHRLALTGTPILNRPAELWTLAHALAPDTFRSWKGYMVRFADAFEDRYGWNTSGASNLEELQSLLRQTIMVRRLKGEVLTELPAKRRAVIELPANPGQAQLVRAELDAYAAHQSALKALRQAVEEAEASEDPDAYSQAVEALRKGASVAFTEMATVRHETALAKVPAMIDVVTDAVEQGKVIFFAWHRDVIAQMAEAFPDAVVVTGDTSLSARQAAVDRFQSDPDCRLFLGNIKAAGVGLTLTAASHVIFGELDWTPANVTQAEDRAHRIGQHDSVLVQHLVLEGSLDATMARTLVEKQTVLDAALDDPISGIAEVPMIITAADETPAPELPETRVSREPAGEGMFKAPDGTIYKVQRAVHGSGRLYAKRLVVTGGLEGEFVMAPGAYSRIDPAWRMSLAEAAAFGSLYGFCVRCGRTLTDEISIANGIGPVCAGRGKWRED